MAFDAFLKLDGIDGESADSKHKNEIDLMSFSGGHSNTGSSALGGGGGSGVVHFQDYQFTIRHQKCSPKLMLACATGDHIKSAIITCRKQGGTQIEFLQITLSDLIVSSYSSGGSSGGEDVPIDSFSLNFSKIQTAYKEQNKDGTAGGAINAGWDVKQKVKV